MQLFLNIETLWLHFDQSLENSGFLFFSDRLGIITAPIRYFELAWLLQILNAYVKAESEFSHTKPFITINCWVKRYAKQMQYGSEYALLVL